MTNNEMLDKLNDYLSQINKIAEEANKLAEEYLKSVEQASEDVTNEVLSEYLKDTGGGEVYYINANGKIDVCCDGRASIDVNSYVNYPSQEFAERAQKLKVFNDMLLAFKWCYDRYYEPDWNTSEAKYYVYYSNCYCKYDVASVTVHDSHNIYFSTAEIAQKCADWLNTIGPEEELIS